MIVNGPAVGKNLAIHCSEFHVFVSNSFDKSVLTDEHIGSSLHTGTTECLLETLIVEAEEFGWTRFPVMARNQVLRSVHTTLGAVMTVAMERMSPSDARDHLPQVLAVGGLIH